MASLEHWSEHSHEMFKRLLDFSIAGDESCSSWASFEYLEDRKGSRIQLVASSGGTSRGISAYVGGVEQLEICSLGSAEVRGRIAVSKAMHEGM